jgi:hypothetical protein
MHDQVMIFVTRFQVFRFSRGALRCCIGGSIGVFPKLFVRGSRYLASPRFASP